MRKKLLITDKDKTEADGRAAALPRLPEKSHSLCEQVKENENQLTIRKDTGSHRAAGERKVFFDRDTNNFYMFFKAETLLHFLTH